MQVLDLPVQWYQLATILIPIELGLLILIGLGAKFDNERSTKKICEAIQQAAKDIREEIGKENRTIP
ncbi:MAG: hypothetical protein ABFD90_02510 [Phycisphaerales bacterium]